MHRRFSVVVLSLLVLAASVGCQAAPASDARPAVVAAFEQRLETSRAELPTIITAAEAAVARVMKNPEALINVPYGEQQAFAEEILNRAGGLANALPSIERRNQITRDDIAMVAIRSWEEDSEKMLPLLKKQREQGWMIVLFASKAGAPDDLDVDYLIDNGAPSGGIEHGRVNVTVNAVNGWLWVCEYTAALTREGRYPGILMSIFLEGNQAHNRRLQRDNRKFLGETEARIAAGELAGQYLEAMEDVIDDLSSPQLAAQVEHAATVMADHVKAGGTIKTATCLHMLMSEIYKPDVRSPFEPFNGYYSSKENFARHVGDGDILLWWGYIGMSTPYEDYGAAMRGTNGLLVSSYVPAADPARNEPKGPAHIDQQWSLPDSVVELPFSPGFMAPASGIEQTLLFRMVDDAVAAKLEGSGG